MKKTLAILLASTMLLALCACGAASSPAATQTPTAATQQPVQTTELTNMLKEITDKYEQGTAGSSLKAAAVAGEMLDWYVQAKPTDADVTAETSAYFATLDKTVSQTFISKLDDVYGAAMQTCGSDGADLLSTAGYTPKGTWTGSDAKTLFTAVYGGTGAAAPKYAAVYSGDEQAEHFLITYDMIEDLTPDNLLTALKNNGMVSVGVKVNSFDKGDGKALTLDLSSDFQKLLSSTGTSGEYMIMGSVVNTFLAAYGADSITITAGGKTIETGHQVYSGAQTMYADNTAK
jgi:surface antigen